MKRKSTFPCPVCGEDVPAKAKACPHCGACDKSGWNEESSAGDGLDLPDDDFDYDKFVAEEFDQPARPVGKQLLWRITAAVLLIVTLVLIFSSKLFR